MADSIQGKSSVARTAGGMWASGPTARKTVLARGSDIRENNRRMFMRRAIGVAMALLFSLPLLAGTISSIDPASIKALSGEYFMTASGSGFAETDEFIFDGPAGHFELTVNAIDKLGAITGWVPLPIVNTPGTYTLVVRSA